jgi:hypothetical protein
VAYGSRHINVGVTNVLSFGSIASAVEVGVN